MLTVCCCRTNHGSRFVLLFFVCVSNIPCVLFCFVRFFSPFKRFRVGFSFLRVAEGVSVRLYFGPCRVSFIFFAFYHPKTIACDFLFCVLKGCCLHLFLAQKCAVTCRYVLAFVACASRGELPASTGTKLRSCCHSPVSRPSPRKLNKMRKGLWPGQLQGEQHRLFRT